MVNFLLKAAAESAGNADIIHNSLYITLMGMITLFISMFVLWGVMELLVRLLKDKEEPEEETAKAAEEVAAPVSDDSDLKMRVAAAAAAFATAKKK